MKTATFPDISEWYTPERIAAEEILWENGPYRDNARRILEVCRAHNLSTVVEVGCGTGWVPTALDPSIRYLAGIDKNRHMLTRASKKNPGTLFVRCDARNVETLAVSADLVCSFAVLKHFSLDEWPEILVKILSIGRYSLFTQHMLQSNRKPMDTGDEFHHIWPTKTELFAAVKRAGHEIMTLDESWIDKGIGAPEAYVTTRRA